MFNIINLLKNKFRKKKFFINLLETQIVDYCNLKCNKCSHFCHLINEEIKVTPEEFNKDTAKLSENFSIAYIKILGGEPLLHPQINQLLKIARKNFPNSKIEIVSNGLLLKKMDKSFWETMRKNHIYIEISEYPILENEISEIIKLIEDNKVKINKINPIKIFYDSFNSNGNADINNAFKICGGKLMVLFKKKLYPCIGCYRHYYNKINNTNIEFPPSIDIYNSKPKDIINFYKIITKPFSACRYCDDIGKPIPWELYKDAQKKELK